MTGHKSERYSYTRDGKINKLENRIDLDRPRRLYIIDESKGVDVVSGEFN